jgi:hypothetical protein
MTARAMATAEGQAVVSTMTTLMTCSAVCVLIMLAFQFDAACLAAVTNSVGPGR